WNGAVEAGAPPGMAGARAGLLHLDPDRVLVAIDPHLDHALDVARTLALAPEALAGAAEIPRLPARDGAPQRLGVPVRDHQHLARARLGHDAGQEPVGVEFRRQHETLFDLRGRAGLGKGRLLAQIGASRASAVGRAHHGDEADLVVRVLAERAGELR